MSGLLLSCPFLFNGFGVAVEANGAVSAIQRNLAVNQSQSDEYATAAPSEDGDDDDDDEDEEEEEERNFAGFDMISGAAKKAMNSLKASGKAKQALRVEKSENKKLKKTMKAFDSFKLQTNNPVTFFKQPNVKKWGEATRKLYGREDEKAYAAMFSTLLTRMKGDEEAVATALGSSHSHYASFMMAAQANHWKAKNLDTTMVYDLLKLRKEGSELFNSPKLRTWENFAQRNNEDSSGKLWQLMTLKNQDKKYANPFEVFSKSDLALLVRANPNSRNAGLYAQSTAKLLLAKWRSDNYPIQWALSNMGVIEPELGVWLAYTSKLQDPYQIFRTAGKFKNEEVKRAINAAQLSDDNNLRESARIMRITKIEQGFDL